ncbi:hypothetical protein CC1G_14840 [Coprinopsis cinerea okayama7|uniref:Tropomyosin n=1 Tax=Coprinopsis cinerea (strain Okayama-7 / 130 / ATCC MYA-4618 / FGSC 9003) TaxID=240176 RepID=D6RNP9_COPC7|nr:hypothetical protein CC1G_14840 [Coprinopsis cinerea okayama7\|eukprot:XP_002910861.1 hypothetical protein CC1G_14840 [Coprinopsis cinerea okayama7\
MSVYQAVTLVQTKVTTIISMWGCWLQLTRLPQAIAQAIAQRKQEIEQVRKILSDNLAFVAARRVDLDQQRIQLEQFRAILQGRSDLNVDNLKQEIDRCEYAVLWKLRGFPSDTLPMWKSTISSSCGWRSKQFTYNCSLVNPCSTRVTCKHNSSSNHNSYLFPMATDRIKAKLDQLRAEADAAVTRAEEAEAKVKKLEQALLEKEQENNSLRVRLERAEAEVDDTRTQLDHAKQYSLEGESSLKDAHNKQKKIDLLEEELDKAEQNLRETAEKLRQVDAKAEQLERQVKVGDQEKEALENKYAQLEEKYRKSQLELEELEKSLSGL